MGLTVLRVNALGAAMGPADAPVALAVGFRSCAIFSRSWGSTALHLWAYPSPSAPPVHLRPCTEEVCAATTGAQSFVVMQPVCPSLADGAVVRNADSGEVFVIRAARRLRVAACDQCGLARCKHSRWSVNHQCVDAAYADAGLHLCPPCHSVTIVISSGRYPHEISWSIPGVAMDDQKFPRYFAKETTYNRTVCMPPGDYTFLALDSWGDGWNGGTFAIYVNGAALISPTSVSSVYESRTPFTVPAPACAATQVANSDRGFHPPRVPSGGPAARMSGWSVARGTVAATALAAAPTDSSAP